MRDPHAGHIAQGWAGRSLERSIVRSMLVGMAVMQGIMILAALQTLGWNVQSAILALAHLLAGIGALTVLRQDRGHLALLLYCWLLFVMDWSISPYPESTLLFSACWMRDLADASPAFLLRRQVSWQAPVGASLLIPLLMGIARPDLGLHPLIPAVTITLLSINAATRIGLSYLLDYTRSVDAETRELETRTAALSVRKAATQQSAEDARVLHDTAINTLGAIANGGAAIRDCAAVRARCLADIATIEALHSLRRPDAGARQGLRDAIRPVGIRVCYSGLSDEALAQLEARLPHTVLQAMSRAAGEAVQNAAKHSGADEVLVSVQQTAASAQIRIHDDGVGIPPRRLHGGGLQRSILARARDAGVVARIDSAPGQGTTVTLEYVWGTALTSDPAASAERPGTPELIRQLSARVVFSLALGLVGVGVALATLNHPGELTPEWLMVAVVAVACGLAWKWRQRATTSPWIFALLLLSSPIAFVLSAWAVGFGRDDPTLWQAIGPTGPLLVLDLLARSRGMQRLGVGVYAASSALTALGVLFAHGSEPASVTAVAGFIGVGLAAAVSSFLRQLAQVATRADEEQRQAFNLGMALAAVDAAAEARRRWREVGLEDSVRLLRSIGEARVDPADPAIRQQCADEEAFLRQLSLLDPELTQMGPWFARALNAARLRGVTLSLRTGSVDTAEGDAIRWGRRLLTLIPSLPAGTVLTVALFPSAQGLSLTLVAPTPLLQAALDDEHAPVGVRRRRRLGQQDLIEIDLPRAA